MMCVFLDGDFIYMGVLSVVENVMICGLHGNSGGKALTLGNGRVINFNKETHNHILIKALTG